MFPDSTLSTAVLEGDAKGLEAKLLPFSQVIYCFTSVVLVLPFWVNEK